MAPRAKSRGGKRATQTRQTATATFHPNGAAEITFQAEGTLLICVRFYLLV